MLLLPCQVEKDALQKKLALLVFLSTTTTATTTAGQQCVRSLAEQVLQQCRAHLKGDQECRGSGVLLPKPQDEADTILQMDSVLNRLKVCAV